MPRHRTLKLAGELPGWIEETDSFCLRSVAEDAYTAKAWADRLGADHKKSCESTYRAGMKSLAKMNDENVSMGVRCSEGDRAARKFWEAKVCARSDSTTKHTRRAR